MSQSAPTGAVPYPRLTPPLTGNFHAVIVCPASQKHTAEHIIASIQRRAIQLEGTITGEHGIGLGLRDMLVEEVGENTVDMMRRVRPVRRSFFLPLLSAELLLLLLEFGNS